MKSSCRIFGYFFLLSTGLSIPSCSVVKGIPGIIEPEKEPLVEISVHYFRSVGFVGEGLTPKEGFASGTDVKGNYRENAPYTITSLSEGIYISGDTTHADIETSGTVRVESGYATKDITVYLFYDMRKFDWEIEYVAYDSTGIDSMRARWVSTSVEYPIGPSGILLSIITAYTRFTRYMSDGTVAESDSIGGQITLCQGIDTLGWARVDYDGDIITGVTCWGSKGYTEPGLPRIYSCVLGQYLSPGFSSYSNATVRGTPKP